jgi:hypothetical protein
MTARSGAAAPPIVTLLASLPSTASARPPIAASPSQAQLAFNQISQVGGVRSLLHR